jgi:hypothetical protein
LLLNKCTEINTEKKKRMQSEIIQTVAQGENVIVDARAGAGKTSLLLEMAACLQYKKIAILTYNRSLTDECNDRITSLQLSHVMCHTIHSMFGACVNKTCQTDLDLIEHGPVTRFSADIVCIDEAQDIRPSYFSVLCKMIPEQSQIVVTGDQHQLLYDYVIGDEADSSYLMNADVHFSALTDKPWKKFTLSGSYRMTQSIADIAACVWDTSIVSLSKCEDVPVTYVVTNPWAFNVSLWMRNLIMQDQVLILSKTVTGVGNPLRSLVNRLIQKGHQFHIKEYLRGFDTNTTFLNKTRVWTFCASKGCESDVVCIFGAESLPCSNDLGVAMSRAKKRLFVIHNPNQPLNKRLEHVNIMYSTLDQHGNLIPYTGNVSFSELTPGSFEKSYYSVTDRINLSAAKLNSMLLNFNFDEQQVHTPIDICTDATVNDCVQDMTCMYAKAFEYLLQVHCKGQCNDGNVMTLNGSQQFLSKRELRKWFVSHDIRAVLPSDLVFPISYSLVRVMCNQGRIRTFTKNGAIYFASDSVQRLRQLHSELQVSKDARTAMRLANIRLAIDSYYDKVYVNSYEWVDQSSLDNAISLAFECFDFRQGEFEHNLAYQKLVGRVDWACDNTVVEIKFTSANSVEHKLQTVLYAAMHACATKNSSRGVLYNARLGTACTMNICPQQAEQLLSDYVQLVCV